MKNLIYIPLMLVCAACSFSQVNDSDKFEKGEPLAEVKGKILKEVSGLAASQRNPRMLWAHNDSGNDAQVFLIDEQLNIRLTCKLAGVANRDWEDIAVGPGPDPEKRYVYVGDIGDNDGRYSQKYIYRFEEPVVDAAITSLTISDFDTITFELPGAIKDTESLMVDPQTRNIYVVSKREDPVHVYELKFPYATREVVQASQVTSLPFSQIVAADVNGNNGDILMKNYGDIYYWENTTGETAAALLKKQPLRVPYVPEPQGESITWAHDGSGFYTLSEKEGKKPSYLYFYALKK